MKEVVECLRAWTKLINGRMVDQASITKLVKRSERALSAHEKANSARTKAATDSPKRKKIDLATKKLIANDDRQVTEVAKSYGISSRSVVGYRREFRRKT